MPSEIPLINGNAYVWADIIVNIGGNSIAGVKAVKFGVKQEKTNNYGAGNMPVSRGRGKKEFEASLTLELAEVEALRASVASRVLTDIAPFDIIIAWIPTDGGGVVRKTLQYCEFLEDMLEAEEGDTTIDIELPLIIGNIKHAA